MKKYKLGLILGRFQIFHKGHESIVNKALELCDKVLILIGSAEKSGDYVNPFNYDTRKAIIEELYGSSVIIAPIYDIGVGNVSAWGDYVIKTAKEAYGMPDVAIYGDEDKCVNWYKNFPNIDYVKVDRNDIPVSTTIIKEHLLENDYTFFKNNMNEKLWKYYSDMRLAITKYKYLKQKENIVCSSDEMILLDAFSDEE